MILRNVLLHTAPKPKDLYNNMTCFLFSLFVRRNVRKSFTAEDDNVHRRIHRYCVSTARRLTGLSLVRTPTADCFTVSGSRLRCKYRSGVNTMSVPAQRLRNWLGQWPSNQSALATRLTWRVETLLHEGGP
jgi:hypothetical protein